MEAIGAKIRRQRRQLGLTLDELSGRTDISKPYLSLIETGRVINPPSDEKLIRLERSLGFPAGELLTQANLQRTPREVRAMLAKLMGDRADLEKSAAGAATESTPRSLARQSDTTRSADKAIATLTGRSSVGTPLTLSPDLGELNRAAPSPDAGSIPVSLDAAYLSGMLQDLVDKSAGNVEHIRTNAVPLINRVAAGYPSDFTDLSYPARVADEYIGCPDLSDPDAFATRVHGDSMTPKYRDGDIVIFSPAKSPRSGDDCFVRFEDGRTTFKRAFFESDDAGKPVIRLQPRNERYKPQTVASEQVSGLYKAVYRFESVDDQ